MPLITIKVFKDELTASIRSIIRVQAVFAISWNAPIKSGQLAGRPASCRSSHRRTVWLSEHTSTIQWVSPTKTTSRSRFKI